MVETQRQHGKTSGSFGCGPNLSVTFGAIAIAGATCAGTGALSSLAAFVRGFFGLSELSAASPLRLRGDFAVAGFASSSCA